MLAPTSTTTISGGSDNISKRLNFTCIGLHPLDQNSLLPGNSGLQHQVSLTVNAREGIRNCLLQPSGPRQRSRVPVSGRPEPRPPRAQRLGFSGRFLRLHAASDLDFNPRGSGHGPMKQLAPEQVSDAPCGPISLTSLAKRGPREAASRIIERRSTPRHQSASDAPPAYRPRYGKQGIGGKRKGNKLVG